MKAYSVHRPLGMGTYPKNHEVVELVNFDKLTWIEEIQRYAFGYVVFAQDVPQCDLDAYELYTPIEASEDFKRALEAITRAYRMGMSEDRIDKMFIVADRKGIDIEKLWEAVDKELEK